MAELVLVVVYLQPAETDCSLKFLIKKQTMIFVTRMYSLLLAFINYKNLLSHEYK